MVNELLLDLEAVIEIVDAFHRVGVYDAHIALLAVLYVGIVEAFRDEWDDEN